MDTATRRTNAAGSGRWSPSRFMFKQRRELKASLVRLVRDPAFCMRAELLLGEHDADGVRRRDLETIESVLSISGEVLILELHECQITTAGHETDFAEAFELREHHLEHQLRRLVRQLRDEQARQRKDNNLPFATVSPPD